MKLYVLVHTSHDETDAMGCVDCGKVYQVNLFNTYGEATAYALRQNCSHWLIYERELE